MWYVIKLAKAVGQNLPPSIHYPSIEAFPSYHIKFLCIIYCILLGNHYPYSDGSEGTLLEWVQKYITSKTTSGRDGNIRKVNDAFAWGQRPGVQFT